MHSNVELNSKKFLIALVIIILAIIAVFYFGRGIGSNENVILIDEETGSPYTSE